MKRGRPSLSEEIIALVLRLDKSGMGPQAIADKLSIGRTSVYRILEGATAVEAFHNSPEDVGP